MTRAGMKTNSIGLGLPQYCSCAPGGNHHVVVVDFHPDVFSLASRFFYDDIPPSNGMLVRVSKKVIDLTTGDGARAKRALSATLL
jgi:threonine dehydrogenase-like Zn-dependent dehydrogenase